MVGYITGHFLEYETGAWVCLSFSVLFFVLYSFMPETPYYLMKTARIKVCFSSQINHFLCFIDEISILFFLQEAEKSFNFYRNVPSDVDSKVDPMLQHELSKLKCAYSEVKSKDAEDSPDAPLKISDFMNRAFGICCILMVAHEIDGEFTMVSYASVIFAKSGSSMFSPGVSSIIVTLIQLIGSYVSSLFIDRVGRKVNFGLLPNECRE